MSPVPSRSRARRRRRRRRPPPASERLERPEHRDDGEDHHDDVLTVAMMPMTTFSRIQAATTRIRSASRRLGKDARPSVWSMPPGYSPRGLRARCPVVSPVSSAGGARRGARGVERGARTASTRRRTRQVAPEKARFDTVAKPASSARSARSRWAMRSTAAGRSSTPTHQQYTRRPPAQQQRARPADEPRPQRAALEHEPGPGVQRPRVVPDEVAEQPERPCAPGPGRRPPRRAGRTTFAPRCA